MLDDLLAAIERLGGEAAKPVVPIELFLDGNEDEASIAPDLRRHPGMERFRDVLGELLMRGEVSDVLAQIDEVLDPPDWPYVPAVYVITSAPPHQVARWTGELEPEDELLHEPWFPDPPGLPLIPADHALVGVWWS